MSSNDAHKTSVQITEAIARGRELRKRDMREASPETLRIYCESIVQAARPDHRESLAEVWRIVASLDYRHPGLAKNGYLAHPLRVAMLLGDFASEESFEGAALAMCHNLIEVGSADTHQGLGEIDALVPGVAEWVEALTIDRERQTNKDYLREYYGGIADRPTPVSQVKVVDKMDNLHILCLNPDAEIRAAYLSQVSTFVVPLAQNSLPIAGDYLKALIADAEMTGYQP